MAEVHDKEALALTSVDGGNNRSAIAAGSDDDKEIDNDGEYPRGAKLWCIVAALVLSMFMVALDMVGYAGRKVIEANDQIRQSLQPPYPESPTNSRALIRLAGTDRPSFLL